MLEHFVRFYLAAAKAKVQSVQGQQLHFRFYVLSCAMPLGPTGAARLLEVAPAAQLAGKLAFSGENWVLGADSLVFVR